eukprot:GEMP01040490.1.p1 GENE.GEMP01040490.1~~GEMP01040490.1.p1  ORF type:complete len:359 (+),score=53.47 GEMP01040490.1:67-1143(+)
MGGCQHGCGRQAHGRFPTCCTWCKGADGQHSRDCETKNAQGGASASAPRTQTPPASPSGTPKQNVETRGGPLDQASIARMEDEVIRALTFVRTKPLEAAAMLEKKLPNFEGKKYRLTPTRVLNTKEGKSAVQECIKFLKKQQPLQPISSVNEIGIKLACEDHVADNGSRGTLAHAGSDRSQPQDRMLRYGQWIEKMGECLWCGNSSQGIDVVLDLIVDDGVSDRGHRTCIFTPSYKVVGVSVGMHSAMGHMCCIDFANRYESDANKCNERKQKGPQKMDPSKMPKNTGSGGGSSSTNCPGCKKPIKGTLYNTPGGGEPTCKACAEKQLMAQYEGMFAGQGGNGKGGKPQGFQIMFMKG